MAQLAKIGRFQFQYGTKSELEKSEIVLYKGEIAFESDTNYMKVGDGKNAYANLPYRNVGPKGDTFTFKDLTTEEYAKIVGNVADRVKDTLVTIQNTPISIIEEPLIALSHLTDTGKDLIPEDTILYRMGIDLDKTIKKDEVGRKIKNSGLVYKITTPLSRVRVFFKAKLRDYTDDENYITMWLGDGTNEEKRWISKIESRTRHYSIDLDVTDSDELTISTLTAYEKDVMIWDFDVVGGKGVIL